MSVPPRKRGTASRQSKAGSITDDGINIVYRYLRDSMKVEYPEGALPELDGPASILSRSKKVSAGGPIPDPEDVRAVLRRTSGTLKTLSTRHRGLRSVGRALSRHLTNSLTLGSAFGYSKRGRAAQHHRELVRVGLVRALSVLDAARSRRPELRYLRLALRRHLELELSIDQAFGYARATRGAAPFPEEREQAIANAVFEKRFIEGLNPEVAAYDAGERFEISKTQALEAFRKHAFQALETYKFRRLCKRHPELLERHSRGETLTPEELRVLKDCRLWTESEEQRLKSYYPPGK